MNYVMINTAGRSTEIAVSYAGVKKYFIDPDGKKASEVLLKQIDELITEVNGSLKEFDFFGCVIGPGSFTGIRIGVGTVKALCYALGKPAKGVTYNRAVSYAANKSAVSIVEGWADNYYVSVYDGEKEIMPPTAVNKAKADEIIERSNGELVCDEGAYEIFGGKTNAGGEYLFVAAEKAEKVDYKTLEPLYAMKSQAERDLENKDK